MKSFHILYNPYANSGKSKEKAMKLSDIFESDSVSYYDITKFEDMNSFVNGLDNKEKIVICGGDGTLNRFVNSVDTDKLVNEIYCYCTGSGNDFLRDIGKAGINEPICITEYLKNLPEVTVKGKTYKFLNNASFGLDGYCCEEADRQRRKNGKSSNYALLAIKGLLFAYKPRNATIIVDGVKKEYKKIWLAPTMNGRYFGGGLMSAPNQNRLNEKHTVSVVAMYNVSRIKALFILPSMFKGKHIKHTDIIDISEGNEISIIYDKPAPMQIDGETIPDVIRCDVRAGNLIPQNTD